MSTAAIVQGSSNNTILNSKWLWQFQVKTQRRFQLKGFNEQFVPIIQETNNFEQLIGATNIIPLLKEHWSSNIQLFRDGIKCNWEDPKNRDGWIIEFPVTCQQDREQKNKSSAYVDPDNLQFLFLGIVSYVLLNENKKINGLYLKSQLRSSERFDRSKEKGSREPKDEVHTYVFQLWVQSQDVYKEFSDLIAQWQEDLKKQKEADGEKIDESLNLTSVLTKFEVKTKLREYSTPKKDVSTSKPSTRGGERQQGGRPHFKRGQ